MLNRFMRDRSGNVAIFAGLTVVMLFGLGGAAVDFIRFTTLRSEIQSAADGAVLAAASLTNNQPPAAVATNYFEQNFDAERFGFSINDVSFTPTVVSNTQYEKTINADVSVDMPTFFLKVVGLFGSGDFETLNVSVNSVATERDQDLEIALVLDVSGSMGGAKIANLRTAGVEFIDRLFDEADPGELSVSIVPFSSNVNLGTLFDDYADPSLFTPPVIKPCVLYEDQDFNGNDIADLRDPVDQIDNFNDRNLCNTEPVLMNSDDRVVLSNRINGFNADGRTDGHIGLAWGVKALSPDLRGQLGGDFSNRPLDFGETVLKVLVVMTDGDLYPIENLSGVRDIPTAEAQFLALCDEAKGNGTIVFSIGFDIDAGGAADNLLRNCASSLSQYFFVEGLDISAAFEGIATTISRLRVAE